MPPDQGRFQAPMPVDYEPFVPPRRNEVIPVDTLQKAAPLPAPAAYYQLANALKGFVPELDSTLSTIKQGEDKEDAAAGNDHRDTQP